VKRLSLSEAVRDAPDRVAVVTSEGELTYAALGVQVERAAAWLSEQGVSPNADRPVALLMTIDLPTLELFWALAALGRPLLLLNERSSQPARASLVERTGAFEVDRESYARARPTLERRFAATESLSPERAFAIVATSGTTGRPKLAVLSERALLASAAAHYANTGLVDDDRWLLCLSPAHVGGLSILTRSLYARRAVVTFEGAGALRSRVAELGRAIAASRATFVSLVPALLEDLIDAGFERPDSLRAILLGGAATNLPELEKAHRLGLPVLPSYGLTEGCSQIAARPYAERFRPPELESSPPSCGRPLPGVELRTGDDERLEFSGPSLLSRYWDEPTPLTDDGYFRTSDRGYVTPEGELVVLGRADDVIITGGEKVDPLAVEAVLLAFPGISAACVFGEPDPGWGNVVAAAVVSAAPLDASALARHCATSLAPHERPRLVARVEALSETPGGKLDRNDTRRSASARLESLLRTKPNTAG
jgi:O-succinylbenzoic acid--CoA ligase